MNSAAYGTKKEWVMNPEAMDRLLSILDSDLGTAVRKFERIRNKLTNLFRWRGFREPERCAAKIIEISARELFAGAQFPAYNPDLYFHRVAIDESHRLKGHLRETHAESTTADRIRFAPFGLSDSDSLNLERQRLLQCLNAGLSALPIERLELITRYHQPAEAVRKEVRKELARSLGISQAALRIRAFKIRSGLERAVTNCLGQSK